MAYYVAFDSAPTNDWHLMVEVCMLPIRFGLMGVHVALNDQQIRLESLKWLVGELK